MLVVTGCGVCSIVDVVTSSHRYYSLDNDLQKHLSPSNQLSLLVPRFLTTTGGFALFICVVCSCEASWAAMNWHCMELKVKCAFWFSLVLNWSLLWISRGWCDGWRATHPSAQRQQETDGQMFKHTMEATDEQEAAAQNMQTSQAETLCRFVVSLWLSPATQAAETTMKSSFPEEERRTAAQILQLYD